MSCSQAFQLFRSCTGSLSARSVARASVPAVRRRAAVSTRFYSDDRAQSAEDTDNKSETNAPGDSASDPTLEKLQKKEAEVVDLTGRLRYLQADFLNLQRNAAREKEQTKDFAITRFATDLLETVDVLSIALKSVPQSALAQSSASNSQ